jgi:hypothetical protein
VRAVVAVANTPLLKSALAQLLGGQLFVVDVDGGALGVVPATGGLHRDEPEDPFFGLPHQATLGRCDRLHKSVDVSRSENNDANLI